MRFLFLEINLHRAAWKKAALAGKRITAIKILKDSGYGGIKACKEKVDKYSKSKKIKFKDQEDLRAYLLGLVSAKNIYFNSGFYLVQIKKDGTHKIIQVGK